MLDFFIFNTYKNNNLYISLNLSRGNFIFPLTFEQSRGITRYLHPEYNVIIYHISRWELAVSQLVEALRCKPEGRGFDIRWCHWNFPLT